MPIVAAILLQSADLQALAVYRDRTRATYRCDARSDANTIVVCGRRDADRYRVPLIEHDPGDPDYLPAMAEREALLARTNNCQEKSVFLVGCGSVGIGMHAGAGGVSLTDTQERPLAP